MEESTRKKHWLEAPRTSTRMISSILILTLFVQFTPSANTFGFNSLSRSDKPLNHKSILPIDNTEDVFQTDRRAVFQSAFVFAAATINPFNNKDASASVIQNPSCVSGEGDACNDLSEGNEYIKSLQEKSAKNREKYEKENLMAYQMKNYPDYFASLNPPRYLVKKCNGSFEALTQVEISYLLSNGKIRMETPKAMGGKVADLTQKPIMVLVDDS